ncbi:MAG: glutathione S-transferase C-terminal domain-containing protein [Hyphomonadaceae bacterium]
MTDQYTLYGMAASLYTGKVRAYMRRNHVPFIEEKAGGERFNTVVTEAVGRWIIPVIETPDGDFVQDGTDILDYFEAHGLSKQSIYPADPKLKVIAHLFELFGGEGILRAAMHYRWNFDDTNLAFLTATFEDVLPNNLTAEQRQATFLHASGRMRKAAVAFGVTPETHETIERTYTEFLALFEAHLENRPFLFGGAPTIADYGLFSPLYAHLGRDPQPLRLMQTTAPRVFRWTERMNAPEPVHDEAALKSGPDLFAFDALPDTLKSMMAFIAEDYLPEITAHVAFINEWLTAQGAPTLKPGALGRGIGMAEFDWRGHTITTAVMPYRLYLLQRLTDAFEALDAADKAEVETLFEEAGLAPILRLKATRRVIRENHLEGWA